MDRRAAIAIALALAACSSSIDDRIRAAHARFDALTAAEAAELVAFCSAARAPVPASYADVLSHLPAMLADVPPTTVRADRDALVLEWWNNSHFEEDTPHPAFDVVCASTRGAPEDRALGRGLWLRDTPPAD